jgi:hypothetical protein
VIVTPAEEAAEVSDEALVEKARAQYADDDIEIDRSPAISRASNGGWVAAWVWVDYEETK